VIASVAKTRPPTNFIGSEARCDTGAVTRSRLARPVIWTLLYALVLIVLLVIPINSPHGRAGYLREDPPFASRGLRLEDVVNVALFVPLGWGLHLIARRAGLRSSLIVAGVVAAGFSLTIETLQYFLPYRYSSFTDVVTNTVGALVGGWIERGRASLRE
jgi:glycopeptide antibiotics resistance protein